MPPLVEVYRPHWLHYRVAPYDAVTKHSHNGVMRVGIDGDNPLDVPAFCFKALYEFQVLRPIFLQLVVGLCHVVIVCGGGWESRLRREIFQILSNIESVFSTLELNWGASGFKIVI